jgi:hypothetical protein
MSDGEGQAAKGEGVDGACRFEQLCMEWEGVDEGSVSGPFDVEGVAGRMTDERGDDEPSGTMGASSWFWDEEVRDMSAIVEETMQGAATNPCTMFHWYSCWLWAHVIRWKIFC